MRPLLFPYLQMQLLGDSVLIRSQVNIDNARPNLKLAQQLLQGTKQGPSLNHKKTDSYMGNAQVNGLAPSCVSVTMQSTLTCD